MVSFIKNKEEKKSSIWDWVLIIILILGGVGFWLYYKNEQTGTLTGFEEAEKLFASKKYSEALKLYQELQGADYLEPEHDSLLSIRLDTLYLLVED